MDSVFNDVRRASNSLVFGLTRGEIALASACMALAVFVGILAGHPDGRLLSALLAGGALFAILVWDIRIVLPILIVSLPFGTRFEMGFGNLYLTTVILMVTYLAWLFRLPASAAGAAFRVDRVMIGIAIFLAVLFLSAFQNIGYLVASRSELLRFVQLYMYVGIFFLVFQLDLTAKQIKVLLAVALVTGVAEAAAGAIQWYVRRGFFVSGTFDYTHNNFAIYMVFIAMLLVGVIMETRKPAVAASCLAGLGLVLYATVFSFSRTAYAGIAVGIVCFLAMPVNNLRKIALAVVSAGSGALAWAFVPKDVASRASELYTTLTGEQVAFSFFARTVMWKDAWKDFLESPILGKGAWAYALRDNFYVKLIAEAGIVGLAAFLLMIYFILRAELKAVRSRQADDFVRGVTLGLFPATAVTLVLFNMSGDFVLSHRFMGGFWLVLALVLLYFRRDGATDQGKQETPQGTLR
jgi:O-antigen ligase